MAETQEIVHALYCDFFERGIRYFLPDAQLTATGNTPEASPSLVFHSRTDGAVDLEWMGCRYHLERTDRSFTEDQVRLLGAIGAVLSARYRSIFSGVSAASSAQLFEGLVEDRYVSAFLYPSPYMDEQGVPSERDVVADAIEVLRESSLITYENRRISSGVILTASAKAAEGETPLAAPYTSGLVSTKSFHRLCDGLHTVFLVNRAGRLVDLVDVKNYAQTCHDASLPAPSPDRYYAHCQATLSAGNICLVLTPNGEIKIFSAGVQVFHFIEGRWRVTDIREKYHEFRQAVGDAALACHLFTVALNLAEHRRGGLFVILDDADLAPGLVAPEDLLESHAPGFSNRVHYLLRQKRALDLERSVLQSIARVDGGIVLDRAGNLLAFGAILRTTGEPLAAQEGGRTTAAVYASRFGLALKISEDGLVSFYRGGVRIWEL